MQIKGILTATTLAVTLSACLGGGGGGGGGSSATLGSFTKFSAVPANTSVRIEGSSQQADYTASNTTVTSIGTISGFGPTTTADVTTDASGNTTAISFTSSGGTNLAFSTANGDTIGVITSMTGAGAAVNAAGNKMLLFARSSTLGWDYQTYGIWISETSSTAGNSGSFSIGAKTPGASIPTTGTATYTGSAGGIYVNTAGTYYFTLANMTAQANFATRAVAFSTTGTVQSQTLQSGSYASNSNLNLSGNLTYAAGTNQMTGTISTVGGGTANAAMTGTATGYFYGPTAQEIGGGFVARGTGANAFYGAFGGKQ